MVRNLPHLHNQAEDVCIIVEHHTLTDIGVELPLGIGHDTLREITFNLAKKLVVDYNFFWWKLHGRGMVPLHTTQHKSVSEQTQFGKALLAKGWVAALCDWIKKLLIEDRDVTETAVAAMVAHLVLILRPMQFFTLALFAKVTSKGFDVEEPNQREELANAILHGGPR